MGNDIPEVNWNIARVYTPAEMEAWWESVREQAAKIFANPAVAKLAAMYEIIENDQAPEPSPPSPSIEDIRTWMGRVERTRRASKKTSNLDVALRHINSLLRTVDSMYLSATTADELLEDGAPERAKRALQLGLTAYRGRE